jgi:hypothetical protein
VGAELLKIHRFDPKTFKKGGTPLAMEFSVSPESAPHLVTAAGRAGLIWIPNNRGALMVRAAFREQAVAGLFKAVIKEVGIAGHAREWGNSHPFTPDGVAAAVAHVKDYGMECDLLIPPESPSWLRESSFSVGQVVEAEWMRGMQSAVVVAAERDLLGFVALHGPSIIALIHNPSRGMAVAL